MSADIEEWRVYETGADVKECRVYEATWFRQKEARTGLPVWFTGDELAHTLATPPKMTGKKSELPLLSFARFRKHRRLQANVEAVSMLGLDIDTPTVDPRGVVVTVHEALGGVETFAYSTSSSMPKAFKLRLLIPYDAPATAEDHRASWAIVARMCERTGVQIDRACSDASRGFFTWVLLPSGAYFHAHLPGEPWPVTLASGVERDHKAQQEEQARRANAAHVSRFSPAGSPSRISERERARRYLATVDPAIQGQNGSAAAFTAALKCFSHFSLDEAEVLDALADAYNPRCVPPWSARELERKVREAAKVARKGAA
ncbi:MAG: hypothetical protein FWD69_15265 [Polyangiaceae bacterium]|nr:hypothetical protein [Polyangiaceae bacterium]